MGDDAGAAAEGNYRPGVILVTGGAGFIGSHVVTRLVELHGYRVVVLDKLDPCASLHNLRSVYNSPHFKFIKGDIQTADLLQYILETEGVDTVLHFAAQTHVDNSFGNSLAFTINNTYGTHVLLEACRVYRRVRRFICVSTDEVYGDTSLGAVFGLPESSSLAPTNPYSAAKAGAELMARAYVTSYKMPIIITRSNNVYGPGQFPEKLIPKFTLLASRGERLPVHGDGSATRSHLYVSDVAEAFDIILHKGTTGEVYNIGSQRERTVVEVAADICRLFGLDPERQIKHVRDRAFQDKRYFICDAKLAALGWQEATDWADGLRSTVDWYLSNGFSDYWDSVAVESALEPHPFSTAPGSQQSLAQSNGTANGTANGNGTAAG
jgi:UDP-glucose 4,6-dehydratase